MLVCIVLLLVRGRERTATFTTLELFRMYLLLTLTRMFLRNILMYRGEHMRATIPPCRPMYHACMMT